MFLHIFFSPPFLLVQKYRQPLPLVSSTTVSYSALSPEKARLGIYFPLKSDVGPHDNQSSSNCVGVTKDYTIFFCGGKLTWAPEKRESFRLFCTCPTRNIPTRSRSPHHARSLGTLPSIRFARHDRLNPSHVLPISTASTSAKPSDIRQRNKNKAPQLLRSIVGNKNSLSCSAPRFFHM